MHGAADDGLRDGVRRVCPPRTGSTVLAYACTFCMRRAVATMLLLSHKGGKDENMKGIIDLNNTKHACKVGGTR
eukprot:2807358-Prymnesium_polylepis.1